MTDSKQPFWRRLSTKTPGQVRAVPPTSPTRQQRRGSSKASFNEFADQSKDAWEEGDDDLDFFARSQDDRAKAGHAQLQQQQQQQQQRNKQGSKDASQPRQPQAQQQHKYGATEAAGEHPTTPAAAVAVLPERATTPVQPPNTSPSRPMLSRQSSTETDAIAGYHPAPAGTKHAAAVAAASPPRSRDDMRLAKFQRLLSANNLDLDGLRQASWSGIPPSVRHTVWMLLCGYLPANKERREVTHERKREEYRGFVDRYYESRLENANEKTFHQISIDVPRTIPSVPTFQHGAVQKLFERVLYIWAIRHPGSGYVQGINDLVTPFFAVFITPHLPEGASVEHFDDMSQIDEGTLFEVEADSFWCMSKLLDGIQDNYTFAQPGIQTKVRALSELVSRIDEPLYSHLEQNDVQFLQFSFRWMNCLLMRELPFRCTVRLWDTYHAEPEGFASFHLYVCAAFLETFSAELRSLSDFQQLMFCLQGPPTGDWTHEQIDLLLAEAYRLKYMFHGARNHLA